MERRGAGSIASCFVASLSERISKMTGFNTDPVCVPIFETAIALLLRLALPIFNSARKDREGLTLDEAEMRCWKTLRTSASLILQRRGVILDQQETEDLFWALWFSHESLHPMFPEGACGCESAIWIRQIREILAAANVPNVATRACI
jgi:hypothetical protein